MLHCFNKIYFFTTKVNILTTLTELNEKYLEAMEFVGENNIKKIFDPSQWDIAELKAIALRLNAVLVKDQCLVPGCRESIASKQSLQKHVNNLHLKQKLTVTCGDCNKVYSSQSNYQQHLDRGRCYQIQKTNLLCEVCKCVFDTRFLFNKHFMDHRSDPDMRKTLPLEVRFKRFYCNRCDSECADSGGNATRHKCKLYHPDGSHILTKGQPRYMRGLITIDLHRRKIQSNDDPLNIAEENIKKFIQQMLSGQEFEHVDCKEPANHYFSIEWKVPYPPPAPAVAKPRHKQYADITNSSTIQENLFQPLTTMKSNQTCMVKS